MNCIRGRLIGTSTHNSRFVLVSMCLLACTIKALQVLAKGCELPCCTIPAHRRMCHNSLHHSLVCHTTYLSWGLPYFQLADCCSTHSMVQMRLLDSQCDCGWPYYCKNLHNTFRYAHTHVRAHTHTHKCISWNLNE